MEEAKRIAFVAISATFFLSAAVIVFWFKPVTVKPSGEKKVTPVLLRTNELKVGMNLYSSTNRYHFGKVIELDRWHEFPDGSTRPGALLRQTNGFKVWTPLKKMSGMMVVQ